MEQPLSRAAILQEMGITPLWALKDALALEASNLIASPVPAAVTSVGPTQVTELANDWDSLEAQIFSCQQCTLAGHRHQAVVGVGDRHPTWLFIGEGPGAEEDVRGEPFVGQAGRLLDSMLFALGLKRGEAVYIANAVKCRPPGNRTPAASEIAACKPYLIKQIQLLSPKIIVLLGKSAVHSVLGEEKTLGSLRQHKYAFGDIPLVVTYHPAYLLRNLPDKAKAWEDLVFARRCLQDAHSVAGE